MKIHPLLFSLKVGLSLLLLYLHSFLILLWNNRFFVCLYDFCFLLVDARGRLELIPVKLGLLSWGWGQPRPGVLLMFLQALVFSKAPEGDFFPIVLRSPFRYCFEAVHRLGVVQESAWEPALLLAVIELEIDTSRCVSHLLCRQKAIYRGKRSMALQCKFLSEEYSLCRCCHKYQKFSVFPNEMNAISVKLVCKRTMAETRNE